MAAGLNHFRRTAISMALVTNSDIRFAQGQAKNEQKRCGKPPLIDQRNIKKRLIDFKVT